MSTKIRDFDIAEHLRTPEEMAAYLGACIAESCGDTGFIARALGVVARAKGMSALARETGLGRESLYKALSVDGNPQLETVLRVTKALGLRLSFLPAADRAAENFPAS
jgi:probable addiction module antidote protein